MAELEIHGVPRSNFVWTVRIALAEKGVPYRLVPVAPQSPEAKAISPVGRIPGARHGDVAICESRAILSYADRVFPGPAMLPADPVAAAKVEEWVSLATSAIDQVLMRRYVVGCYVFPGTTDGSPNRERIERVTPDLKATLALLDRAVTAGQFGGAEFTLADAYLVPMVAAASRFPEGGAALAELPALAGWLGARMARPSVQASIPA